MGFGEFSYICKPINQKEVLIIQKRQNIPKIYRGMEQLVARRAHNPKVTGSSPVPATIEKETLSLKKLRVSFF